MPFLVGGRRVIVVGVPGVGKSTVVSLTVDLLRRRGKNTQTKVFGSVMFDEARKAGVSHRDEMRRLPVRTQRKLQIAAAEAIAGENADILFVDTHVFIRTKEGFWSGLPSEVLAALRPTNLVLIEAPPRDIQARRMRDADRYRDSLPEEDIAHEMEIARAMLTSAGVVSGAPILVLKNVEGQAAEAAQQLGAAVVED